MSISDLPIKRQLPLLTALLLFGVISAATLLSYLGMRESALELGRERLLSLTEQLAGQLQQPSAIILGKTYAAANDPAVRAFIKSPSTAVRAGAVAALQQFAPEQDPNSMQVELWNADRSLALILPEDSKPEPADLDAEFKQCSADPFKAAGAIRLVGDTVAYPVVAAVTDDAGKPVGCLVRWRRASLSPNARKQLSDIPGSQATVYYGQGDIFTDLEKIVPKPPVSLSSTEVARYTRDGNSFMALARPVSGTPWFIMVEFPERVFLAQADRFMRRILVIDFILLLVGVAGAFAMSRSITRPLRSLTEAASGIRGGDYSSTVDIHRKDELGALATAFNAMVVKVRDSQHELERKVQERTLQLEAAPNAMLMVDERGRVTLANAQAERLFGYEQAELLGQPVENLIPERYRGAHPGLRAGFFGHPTSRPMGAGRDLYGLRKDGSEVPVEIGLNPVRIDESTFVLASVIDITERKRAEEAHKASEAELRALFAAMTDVILVLDAKGRYLKIAPTDSSNLYRQPDNLLGKKLHDVFQKEQADFFLKHIRRALDEGRMHRVEYSLQIDDKEIWFDGSVSPMSKDSVIWIGRDITERKQAEQLIRLQATALQSAGHAIVITDNQGAITWVNPAFTTLTGYTLEEVSGRNVRILNSGMHDRAFFKTLWDTILSGQVWRGEIINRRKDGSLYFEEQSITPVMSDAGEIINFIAIKQDITEHKRADEALRDSEERYRLLFESNPHPMWVYDLETLRFLAVNESAVRHYGYSREEFLAMTIKDIRPPEDIPLLLENVSIVQDNLDMAGVWRHLKRDGSIIDVEITTHELTFVGRRAEVVLVNDVTERKKAEEALKEAEEKYRSIFENAVEGIFQSTPEGRFISANPALVRILGYESPEELIAERTNIATQNYVNPVFRDELKRMLAEQGIVVGFECEVFRKDGSKIWVEDNIRAIRDESGALLYYEGSIEDVTERKMLEEQLRQSQKLEAIGQLAGGIAHDFNNLLTAINGYSDLVLRRLQAADPLRHNVEEIKKAGERATALTRHLLAFSRKQVLQPVAIDLNTIVSDMEKMLRRLIGEDVELRTVLASELGTIKADPGQIEQVILNLAVNARDAMPQGGKLTIETENVYLDEEYATHHVAVKPGHYVMLAVSDTGTGIDEKTRAHIFEPFFTTKEVGKGTGLGLSTVYGIVKQSGGNIWVYSEVGQGTTFKVYLPRVAEGAQEYRRSVAPKEALQGKETILLAEDDEMVRNLVLEVLKHYGYHVLEASNGGAALLICERHKGQVHLLITDVVMPEMSGRELAVRLSQLRPDMKVLFMSGYTDNAIVDQGVLAEGTPFIQKPFAPDALAHKVKEVLEQQGGKRKDERRTIQEE